MDSPEPPARRGLEPRLVFAFALIAVPILILAFQVILFRSDGACGDPDHAKVGGLSQLFLPGDGCPVEPKPRTPG